MIRREVQEVLEKRQEKPGGHRGAQRINEPSAYAMSFLRTPEPEAAKAFYGAVLGWTTEAFGPMLLWRLEGYVGGSRAAGGARRRGGDGGCR